MKARTKPIGAAAALVALAVAAGACGSISREVARDKKVDADLAAVNATGVPGVSILVRQGASTSRVASGVADVATGAPVKVSDQFRIGSISKSFVSVVVLQLAQEHKLSLEDSVARWLPGLVPNGDKITVRQLLNHTSGIANYEEHPDYMAPYLKGDFGHVTTPAQLVRMGVAQGPLFPPGTSSAYSNTNYTVAGLIVEKVTGTTLGDQLTQRIFTPLKLGSTSLPTSPEITGPHAHGYFVLAQPPATDVTTFSPSIGWAGGGIVSTTDDVTTFYKALLGGRLLSPEMLAQMMTTVPGTNGEMYGLGLAQRELPCGTVWGHGGNFPGFLMESYSSVSGEHQVTVAYNMDPNSMQPPTVDAVQKLLVDAYCG
jgi:D-alanyl-D-alanine carboxypeptidase